MTIAYCDRCWTVNQADAVVCSHCGADFATDSTDLTDRMIRALCHPLPDQRAFAARWLGEVGTDRAGAALREVAQSPRCADDMELLCATAEGLGRSGRADAVEALARLARHRFLAVRAAAARGLGQLATPQAHAELAAVSEHDPSTAVREIAAEALRGKRPGNE